MNFNELIEEIKRQRKYAADTLEDATAQTIQPRKSRKENAKLRLQDLFFSFRNEIRNKIVPILIVGSEVETFTNIAKDSVGLSSIGANALYDTLAQKLSPDVLKRGESSAYILEVAGRYLEDVAIELGVQSYPRLSYQGKYDGKIKSREEASALIKRAIEEQVGSEMTALMVLDKALREVFEDDVEAKVYPTLVQVSDLKTLQIMTKALNNLGNKYIIVSAGTSNIDSDFKAEEVTEKTVLEVLKKVKKKIKQ